jgi:4a-hydroxytetrahydrobiopterin dehydratase
MISLKKCTPCQGGVPPLNKQEISVLFSDLSDGWEVYEDKELRKEYFFNTYKDAISFVNILANLSEEEAHHPFIHINYKKVVVILFTHKINGLHENDFILASKCDGLL